jgi:hypothetical protein
MDIGPNLLRLLLYLALLATACSIVRSICGIGRPRK